MSKIWSICKRELLSYFVSPIAYILLTGFLLIGGYFFLNLLSYFNIIIERYAQMPFYQGAAAPSINQMVVEQLYQLLIFLLVFIVPFLSMRLIAEDRRRGTFELLITSPLSVSDIVLGKFLGVAIIVVLMVLVNWAFPALLILYSDPEIPPIFSGLLGVILCALAFASITMAISSFTENQIIGGILGAVALVSLYFAYIPAETIGGGIGNFLRDLSPAIQAQDMIRGVISFKSVSYFVSAIIFGLFLTQRVVEAQRWR